MFKKSVISVSLSVVLTVLGSLAGTAHATRPFVFTESAVALPPKGIQLEIGLSRERWDRGDNVYALTSELSYSLYTNLDLEVELPYEVSGGGGQGFADGVGDIRTKAKINFVKERAANPLTLSGLLSIKFPTGSAIIGTNEVDVQMMALASKPFGTVMVHANFSYTFIGDDGALDLNDVFGLSTALEFATPIEQLTAVGEVVWQESPSNGGSNRFEILGGALYQLLPQLRTDAMLHLGLASGAPPSDGAADFGLEVGLTYSFQ